MTHEPRGFARRRFLQVAGTGAAALAAPRTLLADAAKTKPNVLFLFTDDEREDTIAALGNPHIKTPNLDALVKSGTVFRNAYCMGGFSGAVCLPSRMMTLRGRSWFSVRGLPGGFPNFPKSMKAAGYETWHLGKQGNTDQAVHKDFDHSAYLNVKAERMTGYPCRDLADRAIGFLKTRGKDKPFFMYLAPGNPHDPRIAARKYLDKYDPEKIPLPTNYRPFHPFNNGEMLIRDERLAPWPRTEKEIRRHLRDYYAVITAMDEQIGHILQALKDTNQYQNTLIIFSSDQGLAVGSHGLMGKQNLYEHTMGVPLVFSGPGIPKGKTTDAFAYLFDVYPTVCDLVGATVPKSLEGKSLAPIIGGKGTSVRDTIFLAYKGIQRAVRRGRWKLIRYPQVNVTQLFDLQTDPHEIRDLSADPAHAGRATELLAAMAEQQKLFGDTQPLTVDKPRPGEVDLKFFKGPPARGKRREPKKRSK